MKYCNKVIWGSDLLQVNEELGGHCRASLELAADFLSPCSITENFFRLVLWVFRFSLRKVRSRSPASVLCPGFGRGLWPSWNIRDTTNFATMRCFIKINELQANIFLKIRITFWPHSKEAVHFYWRLLHPDLSWRNLRFVEIRKLGCWWWDLQQSAHLSVQSQRGITGIPICCLWPFSVSSDELIKQNFILNLFKLYLKAAEASEMMTCKNNLKMNLKKRSGSKIAPKIAQLTIEEFGLSVFFIVG